MTLGTAVKPLRLANSFVHPAKVTKVTLNLGPSVARERCREERLCYRHPILRKIMASITSREGRNRGGADLRLRLGCFGPV